MKRRERVSSFLIVEAGLILLNILCYGDIRWLLLEQILLFPCFNVLKRKKREKEKHLYEKESAAINDDFIAGRVFFE